MKNQIHTNVVKKPYIVYVETSGGTRSHVVMAESPQAVKLMFPQGTKFKRVKEIKGETKR